MSLIITLIVALVIFCLLWAAVGYVPTPAPFPWLRNVLYVVLLLVAAYFLYVKFVG